MPDLPEIKVDIEKLKREEEESDDELLIKDDEQEEVTDTIRTKIDQMKIKEEEEEEIEEDIKEEEEYEEDYEIKEEEEDEDYNDILKNEEDYNNNNDIKEEEEDSDSDDDGFLLNESTAQKQAKVEKEMEQNNMDMHKFLPEHPQHKTHQSYLLPEAKARIPNFAGGVLPRKDKGNREDYCMTMLMLFKPWRTGLDLKTKGDTWDETFESYEFTDRHEEIMKFFHIKYECNDARDDYHAQRKAGKGKMPMPFGLSEDTQDLLDNQADDERYVDGIHPADMEYDNDKTLSSSTIRKDQQMKQAENMMKTAGATKFATSFEVDVEAQDGEGHSPTGWKAILTKKRDDILLERDAQAAQKAKNGVGKNTFADQVKVVDQSYLRENFQAEDAAAQRLIDSIVVKFTLNTEQERAFRIIANHASQPSHEQLKMYLGGMAGTGKSQVIKSVAHFFSERNESYRFQCIAPTGAAASLIQGSTYHSMLGLGQYKGDTIHNTAQVYQRLKRVEYIFLDEVSMVDCRYMYKICAQMCKATNNSGLPFGGINIICAGDFAQLPPAMTSYTLYSNKIHTSVHTTGEHAKQESVIGKAVWHQFTTVVILRQNMRQKTQSKEDAKFRTALENMRYKMCTTDDIKI